MKVLINNNEVEQSSFELNWELKCIMMKSVWQCIEKLIQKKGQSFVPQANWRQNQQHVTRALPQKWEKSRILQENKGINQKRREKVRMGQGKTGKKLENLWITWEKTRSSQKTWEKTRNHIILERSVKNLCHSHWN